jgi:drug/metabolite transporter (DMT)-like permease
VCYFRALKIGAASRVFLIDKLNVVLIAIFAFVLLDERPPLRDWMGIVAMAAGAILPSLKTLKWWERVFPLVQIKKRPRFDSPLPLE